MIKIQDEDIFKENLKNNYEEISPLIEVSTFYFKGTGSFAYYYDHSSHEWNQEGLIVTIATNSKYITQWKKFNHERLKQIFNDSLDPDSCYDVVDVNYRNIGPNESLPMKDSLLKRINSISTRNAIFESRSLDERLALINNTIENILKPSHKFLTIDENNYFGFLTNEKIKDYRKLTQPFRHGTQNAISDRKMLSDKQKDFLVNYGTLIVIALSENEL